MSVRRLLLVDDEPNVLKALRRVFHKECEIACATSAEEGLRLLREADYGVVLTDQKMPGTSGVAFLEQVRRTYPDTMRLMLTGYSELEAIIGAINQGAVYKLLFKPWDEDALRAAVREAFGQYELVQENRRLWRELEAANASLAELNLELEQRVEARTRDLLRLTHHDMLTGLPNRLLFTDRLDQSLRLARHQNQRVGVLRLDLDRFQLINDSLGHGSGDRLLVQVAERLSGALRSSDTVARLGDDEFIVLLPGLEQDATVERIAEELRAALAQPFVVDGQEIFLTACQGISLYPQHGEEANLLMQAAGSALTDAKRRGRDRIHLFRAELNHRASRRLSLESRLRRALDQEQFELYYQPQLDVAGGSVVGAEALLRWNEPEHGLILPDEFIPVLEETGLIDPVGEWVLTTACRQNRCWHEAGYENFAVAVNLSPRQFFNPRLVQMVEQTLDACGLDGSAECLEFEITESMIMEDVGSTLRILEQLSARGVRLAVDDFGTGYSSLAYLKRFPVDTLKIDRIFIKDIGLDPDYEAIVSAIIAMARNLGLAVVAEGVENAIQLEYLRQRECDQIQGFLCAQPMPAADLTVFLQKKSGGPRL